jgi:hypothetical protein
VRHPDLAGPQVQNECVLGVEPFPAGHDLGPVAADDGSNLARRRYAAKFDQARVGQVRSARSSSFISRFGSLATEADTTQ